MLSTVPASPPDLALSTEFFFHQDTYSVPGYPYAINWVRTIQPAGADPTNAQALIVDIDVFTNKLLQLGQADQDTLSQRLQEMRWLKNKVFFSCMTSYALERFGATL
ncbi:MAG: TIGR04255 family protein [Synechococcaceae cyanobacterium RM1_1_27]|nr:TIGR04255 family protein [Synechococcaceae cyanobacterium RM1_1_27]